MSKNEHHLDSTVHNWLLLLDMPIDKRYIRQRLLSHPDFPSALCITSLLDDLGIENDALFADQTEAKEIPTPFLAFIDNEKFSIITHLKQIENLKDRWNGVVITAERTEKIFESDELKKNRSYTKGSKFKWAIAISLTCVLFGLSCFNLSLVNILSLIVALLGLTTCSLIVLQELGVKTSLSKQFCGEDQNSGCEQVLQSKASSLGLGIKLSDIGVSFFSGVCFLLLIQPFASEAFQQTSNQLIKACYLISIPFTLASIFYQWRVIKQWCVFCLTVIAVLWSGTVVVSSQSSRFPEFSITLEFVVGIFLLPGSIWILVRQQLNQILEINNANFLLKRIYRSPEILASHLFRQEKIDITPWPHDFQIGNANAPCQLIIVSSHFCGPCSETHRLLQELNRRHKNNLGITIRTLDSKNELGSKKRQIKELMLQYAMSTENFFCSPERIDQMFTDWYQTMDIEEFKKLYPVSESVDVDHILDFQTGWFKKSNIRYTPMIIVNGYKLESPYSQDDLVELSSSLIEIFSDTVVQEESH